MNRRHFLAGLVSLRVFGRDGAKPNFVFILADDFGWRDLGCYDNEFFATPNLDKLAAQGARFTNAYAACLVCSPTRASILTGKYPVRTGVTKLDSGRASSNKGPIITTRTATELNSRKSRSRNGCARRITRARALVNGISAAKASCPPIRDSRRILEEPRAAVRRPGFPWDYSTMRPSPTRLAPLCSRAFQQTYSAPAPLER